MHRALKAYDVIFLICKELECSNKCSDNIEQAQDGNPTPCNHHLSSLSALARTCKDFYEPVMQILCKKLDSIYPIFHVFIVNIPDAASPLSAELLARFTTFSQRVRYISLDFGHRPPPKYAATQLSVSEALEFLNHKTGSMYLLPRLQSLQLEAIAEILPEEILPSLSTLITPSLLNLTEFGFGQTITHGILSLCSLRNVRLKSCDADFSLEWVETSGHLDVISGCEVIRIGSTFQKGLLYKLATFPNLREFEGVSDTFTGRLPRGAFGKLRKFEYFAPESSSFLHFLQQLPDASSLSGISFLAEEETPRLEDGRDVAETLFQCPQLRPEIITRFHIALAAPLDLRMMSDTPSDAPWMSLFARCINMEWIVISLDRPLVITDAEFEQIVCNWHRLEMMETFSCRGNFREPIQPLFSFGKINALVKHCPGLNTLTGFIDTTDLTNSTLEKITSHNDYVDGLYFVTCSIVSDAELVARHLYAWFPNLAFANGTHHLCPCQLGPGTNVETLEAVISLVWDLVDEELKKLQGISEPEPVAGNSDDEGE